MGFEGILKDYHKKEPMKTFDSIRYSITVEESNGVEIEWSVAEVAGGTVVNVDWIRGDGAGQSLCVTKQSARALYTLLAKVLKEDK
jgi:hypothetical protein